ncbi:MAG: peptidoglycan-binding domain-containing protein [Solirubrobacterales bacterium]
MHRSKFAALLAAGALALLAAGPLSGGASGQEPAPAHPAANNPLAGDGMWIWYVRKAQGGKPKRIAKRARKRGIEVVLIKSGDGSKYWGQFSGKLVRALHARGLKVCAWQFVYGRSPAKEARVAAAAADRGADCFVIDAEGHYEGRYTEAQTYMGGLRSRVGPDYPIALATFPYVDYHPAFPYSVFLGPGGAQYNAPQLYWKTIGDAVDTAFVHTYVFNRAYDRPILPLGQVYLNPPAKQIRRFRALAASHQMQGVSWWSWQHAGKKQWKAVGGRTGAIGGYQPYNSYPFLRQGSKGDLVAWAQQLLVGGGYYTPITGYFESPTTTAVLQLQAAKGLTQTGNIDVPTWDVLLQFEPVAVRWTKSGAYPARARGANVLPEPRSAKLPAKRYEIPPPRARRPR